jgi:5-methylcytosine-specific restriction endonuclease McrA
MRRGRQMMHRRVPARRRAPAHRRDAHGRDAHRPRPYASIPRWAVRALRAAAFKACGRRCAYCAEPLRLEGATLDHVVPRRLGGDTTAENLVVACYDCNVLKGGRSPYDFFFANPWAAHNFLRLAARVACGLKHEARVAVSLAHARAA